MEFEEGACPLGGSGGNVGLASGIKDANIGGRWFQKLEYRDSGKAPFTTKAGPSAGNASFDTAPKATDTALEIDPNAGATLPPIAPKAGAGGARIAPIATATGNRRPRHGVQLL